jgi:hypothetical protein
VILEVVLQEQLFEFERRIATNPEVALLNDCYVSKDTCGSTLSPREGQAPALFEAVAEALVKHTQKDLLSLGESSLPINAFNLLKSIGSPTRCTLEVFSL